MDLEELIGLVDSIDESGNRGNTPNIIRIPNINLFAHLHLLNTTSHNALLLPINPLPIRRDPLSVFVELLAMLLLHELLNQHIQHITIGVLAISN